MSKLMFPSLALLFCSVIPAAAQDLSVGFRAGVNFASADASGSLFEQDVGTRTALHVGAVGLVDISQHFGIQTEVLYSQKGFAASDGTVSLDVNYFEIPVLAVLRVAATVSPHLYIGPVLSLESGCSVDIDDLQDVSCERGRRGAPRTKGADFGLRFGTGVSVEAGPGTLLVDALYSLGLTNIAQPADNVDHVKTRTWHLSAAFLFRVGQERTRVP